MCSLPNWQLTLILVTSQVLYMGLEAWLGKTDKVESGSLLELIWRAISISIKPKGNL